MRIGRSTLALALIGGASMVIALACSDSVSPPAGVLDSEIIQGEVQSMQAGEPVPEAVIDRVFRRRNQTALVAPPLWQRMLLPAVAYAQSVDIDDVQPNSPVCQKQPVGFLVAEIPCVTSDAQGHALFTFALTTKSGTHCAIFQATYGTESTIPDTACVTVEPDVADPDYRTGSLPLRCSPAALPIDAVQDQYENPVPYRIVSDARITAQGDTIGTTAARTVTFTALTGPDQYFLAELRGANNILVGRLQYTLISSQGACTNGAPYINWTAAGVNQSP